MLEAMRQEAQSSGAGGAHGGGGDGGGAAGGVAVEVAEAAEVAVGGAAEAAAAEADAVGLETCAASSVGIGQGWDARRVHRDGRGSQRGDECAHLWIRRPKVVGLAFVQRAHTVRAKSCCARSQRRMTCGTVAQPSIERHTWEVGDWHTRTALADESSFMPMRPPTPRPLHLRILSNREASTSNSNRLPKQSIRPAG
eukprot:7383207-Prymnesium_polylepis.1